MCTVTVRNDARGLLVTMNRDEAADRAPELPPRVAAADGLPWLGPRDGARGGAWFGVNARGVVACLLNRYQDAAPPLPDAPSRGALVPAALARGGCAEARAWAIDGLDPAPYPPFTLIIAAPGAGCAVAWDGRERAAGDLTRPWAMVTSSLFAPEEVAAWRARAFEAWLAGGAPFTGALPAFHLIQPPGDTFHPPLMDRGVSRTRSVSQAEVPPGGGPIRLRYGVAEGRPPAGMETHELPAQRGGAAP